MIWANLSTFPLRRPRLEAGGATAWWQRSSDGRESRQSRKSLSLGATAMTPTAGILGRRREGEQPVFWGHLPSFWKTCVEHVRVLGKAQRGIGEGREHQSLCCGRGNSLLNRVPSAASARSTLQAQHGEINPPWRMGLVTGAGGEAGLQGVHKMGFGRKGEQRITSG